MRDVPNFGEFYQRELIPIGSKDQISVTEHSRAWSTLDNYTHWLMALEGNPVSPVSESYEWQVLVFPAEMCGTFSYSTPCFVSKRYTTFAEAIQLMKELEEKAKKDQFFTLSVAN
ncbi:hypothetical protein [Bacillus alkalicellulosilyticus]|uniref:hypothetical protein n=1 Tax=Alkalihalobacterium alkalicellulosilyticum TaxID=1912214 RepID=UPI000997FADD|nr:hypothetical protein [Bacillus alkalicellulosilyticus]